MRVCGLPGYLATVAANVGLFWLRLGYVSYASVGFATEGETTRDGIWIHRMCLGKASDRYRQRWKESWKSLIAYREAYSFLKLVSSQIYAVRPQAAHKRWEACRPANPIGNQERNEESLLWFSWAAWWCMNTSWFLLGMESTSDLVWRCYGWQASGTLLRPGTWEGVFFSLTSQSGLLLAAITQTGPQWRTTIHYEWCLCFLVSLALLAPAQPGPMRWLTSTWPLSFSSTRFTPIEKKILAGQTLWIISRSETNSLVWGFS